MGKEIHDRYLGAVEVLGRRSASNVNVDRSKHRPLENVSPSKEVVSNGIQKMLHLIPFPNV